MKLIAFRFDRRFKVGNVKKDKKGVLRGAPETLETKTLDVSALPIDHPYTLNPPIVVSYELGETLKREWGIR